MARVAGAEAPGPPTPLLALIWAAGGALATFVLLQAWSTMATAEQPLLWWAGRALGILAYVALWLSMVFGTLVSSRGLGGRLSQKWVMDLHQEWSLVAVIATALHVLVLVTHEESHLSPWAAVVPSAAERLTGAIALGTMSAIGMGLVTATSWMRSMVPHAAWRAIHALAFGAMVLAIVHSIAAGTDSDAAWAQALYLATSAVLSLATVLRVALALVPSSGRSARVR